MKKRKRLSCLLTLLARCPREWWLIKRSEFFFLQTLQIYTPLMSIYFKHKTPQKLHIPPFKGYFWRVFAASLVPFFWYLIWIYDTSSSVLCLSSWSTYLCFSLTPTASLFLPFLSFFCCPHHNPTSYAQGHDSAYFIVMYCKNAFILASK